MSDGGRIVHMRRFKVMFYTKTDGSQPVIEFLEGLDEKMRAKVARDIDLLADKGIQLREPHSKYLQDGIFELRTKVSSDISRVLYFFVVGYKIVLTNGFIKKTRRTPPSEIERARQYRIDYFRRKEQEEHD